MPLVSILVPTYNRAGYLRDALQSAVGQTHEDLEILILDDASPDETAAVAAQFSADPRVQYIRHPNNLGIAGNWRAGIERAQGEFFCLLHDDDTFEPEFVERLIAPMLADPALIVSFCDHWVMDEAGRRLAEETREAARRFRRDTLPEGRLADWAEAALIQAAVPVGASLFRRRRVSSDFVDDRAKGAIDLWLFYQCVKAGAAYYTACRLMNYRRHSGGMSRSAALYMGEGHLFRARQILADPQMTALHPQVRRQLAGVLASYGIDLLVAGRAREARASLKESLTLERSRRALAAYGLAWGGRAGVKAAQAMRAK